MENAPYPLCHAKVERSGDWSFNHLEEDDFRVSRSFEVVRVRGSLMARWTWSATPPTR